MRLDVLDEAQIHREIAITILKGALRERGSKTRLAQQAGITPQYLSYLLDPFDHRFPAPETIRRIANLLPLDQETRTALVDHYLLARACRTQALTDLQAKTSFPPLSIERMACRLSSTLQKAQYSQGTRSGVLYRLIYTSGMTFIRCLPTHHPVSLPLVRLFMCVHNAACVLNRHAEALYLVKKLSFIPPHTWLELTGDRQQAVSYQIRVHLEYAVTLYNLNNLAQADAHCEQAEALLRSSYTSTPFLRAFWIPHLYRDRLNILGRTKRFPLAQAEGWADQLQEILAAGGAYTPEEQALLSFLGQTALVRVYLQRNNRRNRRRAKRILTVLQNTVDALPIAGSLHRTLFFKTAAAFYRVEGDLERERFFITLAQQEAGQAGLTHQQREIEKEGCHL